MRALLKCMAVVYGNEIFNDEIGGCLLWEPLKTPVEHLERQIYL